MTPTLAEHGPEDGRLDDLLARGAGALRAGGRLDEAETAFRRALAGRPDCDEALLGLAVTLRGGGRLARSAVIAERAVAVAPDRAAARYHAARALLALGRTAAAADRFREAIALDPWLRDARCRLGDLLRKSGRADAAIVVERTFTAIDPTDMDGWRRLGASHLADGAAADATRMFRRALLLTPDAADTFTIWAWAARDAGLDREAAAVAGRAIAHDPTNARFWLLRSRMSGPSLDTDAAKIAIDRALIVDPTDDESRLHLLFVGVWRKRYPEILLPALALAATPSAAPERRSMALALAGECCARTEPDPDALSAAITAVARADDDRVPPWALFISAMYHQRRATGDGAVEAPVPDPPAPFPPFTIERGLAFMTDPELNIPAKAGLLNALGFTVRSPRGWTMRLFETLVIPAIASALERGDFMLARHLVILAQWSVFVQPHTAEQAAACYRLLAPTFRTAGRTADHRLRPTLETTGAAGPAAGTVFLMDSLESQPRFHLEEALSTLFRFADPWRERLGPFAIVALDDVSEAFRARYRRLGVEVVTPRSCPDPDGVPPPSDPLIRLVRWIRDRRFATAVHFNLPEGFADMLAPMRPAPTQVFLSADHHHVKIPELDGLMTFGSLVRTRRTIRGAIWRCTQFPLKDTAPPKGSEAEAALDARARAIREREFPEARIILGAIARPEKLGPEFLDALARILLANQDAVFLWFGQAELPEVTTAMAAHGILPRCRFQGWRDPALYARVLDIHLDTFPFPMGLTMFDTLCAGRGHVGHDGEKAMQLSFLGSVKRLMDGQVGSPDEREECRSMFRAEDGGSLFAFARDTDEYVSLAQRQIDDPVFRDRVGRAGRRCAERFMLDQRRTADSFFTHLHEMSTGHDTAGTRADIPD